jgi:hypothetical protein
LPKGDIDRNEYRMQGNSFVLPSGETTLGCCEIGEEIGKINRIAFERVMSFSNQ